MSIRKHKPSLLLLATSLLASAACFGSLVPAPTAASYQAPAYSDPSFDHSREELEQFIGKWTAEHEPLSDAESYDLSAPRAVSVSLERGFCYTMVLRLAENATFSDHARGGVGFEYLPDGGGATVNGGPGIHGPGGVGSAGCPQQSGTYSFNLKPARGPGSLGDGSYSLQLFKKPISKEKLAALAADMERQRIESEEFKRKREQEKLDRQLRGCSQCRQEYNTCIADWRRGASKQQCANEHRSCVFSRAGLPGPNSCPR